MLCLKTSFEQQSCNLPLTAGSTLRRTSRLRNELRNDLDILLMFHFVISTDKILAEIFPLTTRILTVTWSL